MDCNLKAAIGTIGATLILFSVAQVQHLEERIDEVEAFAGEAKIILELLREKHQKHTGSRCETS